MYGWETRLCLIDARASRKARTDIELAVLTHAGQYDLARSRTYKPRCQLRRTQFEAVQVLICVGLPYFERTTPFTSKSGLPGSSLTSASDDHGSLVIFRSVSVRPIHLFDPYFDHD
jgi:hypothetical protein